LNNEAVEAAIRQVSPAKGTSSSSLSPDKRAVGGKAYLKAESAVPLPLVALVDFLNTPEHGYLRQLYHHYAAKSSAMSPSRGGSPRGARLGQDGFELFLRESGTWDDVRVDLNTVETVLTQVLGSNSDPDSALTWDQFTAAIAMLVQKKAPARSPNHNYHLAAHVAFMPLLVEQCGHFQALSIRLF